MKIVPGESSKETMAAIARARAERELALSVAKRLEENLEELEKACLCQVLSEAMSSNEAKQSSVVRIKHDAYFWRFQIVQGGNKNDDFWKSTCARLDGFSTKTKQAFHRSEERDYEIWLKPSASSPMEVAIKLGWPALAAHLEAIEIAGETNSAARASTAKQLAL
jgi:hypothetical protein